MAIKIIKEPIPIETCKQAAQESFGEMVKAVVDIKQGIIALGGELHADGEALLLQQGSKQEDLWGVNIYPEKLKEQMIEYIALINVRPSLNNRSMEVEDPEVKIKIQKIINNLIT